MDPRLKRILDLRDQIQEEYDLLKEEEEAYRLESEPKLRRKRKQDIKDLKAQIEEHNSELLSLNTALRNNPLDLPDEIVDKPFIDKPDEVLGDSLDTEKMPDTPVDLLASAIPYHT